MLIFYLIVRLNETVNQQLAGVQMVLAGMVVGTAHQDPTPRGDHSRGLVKYHSSYWQRRCRPAGGVGEAVHVRHAAVFARCVKVVERGWKMSLKLH
jgi:hypothetical protein